jgi:hypothetical protein
LTFASIPLNSGVFFLVTLLLSLVNPKPTKVARIFSVLPMQLFTMVKVIVSAILLPYQK